MKGLCRRRVVIRLPRLLAGLIATGIVLLAAAPAGATPVALASPGNALTSTLPSAASLTPFGQHPNRRVCPGPLIGTASCHARIITDSEGTPLASSGPTGYGPAQFHGAYELPKTAPTEQTVAIIDAYDAPTIEEDLAVYSETYGLPACTEANGCFRKVNQDGQKGPYPKVDTGWAVETSLDVETVHAICQNCKILLVEASSAYFSDLMAAVNTAAAMGATQISNSYGGPEFSSETSGIYATAYDHPGIAITVSAGDSGYAAEYPASSPSVVAVGGTTLNLGAGNTYGSESVWSGSGSGCSPYVSAKSWQTSDPHWPATGCGTKRGVADIAADANPNTGAAVYDSTKDKGQAGWFQVGGTSLSAPLIAAVYALAGGGGSDYPAADPYGHQADSPASLHDVTSGSNGSCGGTTMCAGATGYDGPTGVGTPKGTAAFAAAGGGDTTPPQTTISSAPSSPTNDSTPTFSFSSSESGSTFECRVDAAAFASCSSPFTTTVLADGSHTFEVRAKDGSGNTDSSPATAGFTVDTQPPSLGLTSPADGSLTGTTPALSGTAGTASGDSSTVTVRVYAGSNTSGTLLQTRTATRDPSTGAYSVAATALGSGIYTARASQADSAGNTALSTAHTFTVDATAPASQASAPTLTNSTSISVSYTASDSGGAGLASVELWVKPPGAGSYSKAATDSSPGASGSFSYTAGAGDGTYGFYTRAVDGVGNYEAAPGAADANTMLDATPPQTTISSAPGSFTNDSTPSFSFSSSEGGSTFECRVDAAAFGACTSSYTSATLADGAHTFEVRAKDGAGNIDSTPAVSSFTVDTVSPASQAESIATTNSTTIAVSYTASDSGSGLATVELWVKPPGAGSYSKAATDSTPSASESFLYGASSGDGTYSFYTRATDKAGNSETAPASADSTTVLDTSVPDTTPPDTAIDSAPGSFTNDSTPTFEFTSTELGSTFECSLDGKAFATCSSPYTAPVLGDGPHTFEVRAKDGSGNTDSSPATAGFTVDATAPASEAGAPTLTNSTSISVSYAASDSGGAGLASVELWVKPPGAGSYSKAATDSSPGVSGFLSYDATGGDGTYSFYTRAVDGVGNEEAAAVSADATTVVDTTPPKTKINGGPASPSTDSTPTFHFSADEAASFECRLDSAPFSECESPYTASQLAAGAHVFEVRAIDTAGNVEPEAAGLSFTIEAPEESGTPVAPSQSPSAVESSSGEPPPPVRGFRLARVEVDGASGSTAITLHVPGPGTLVVAGRAVRKLKKAVPSSGMVTLPVRPKARFKGRISRAKVLVTFTPIEGEPTTLTVTVRLR